MYEYALLLFFSCLPACFLIRVGLFYRLCRQLGRAPFPFALHLFCLIGFSPSGRVRFGEGFDVRRNCGWEDANIRRKTAAPPRARWPHMEPANISRKRMRLGPTDRYKDVLNSFVSGSPSPHIWCCKQKRPRWGFCVRYWKLRQHVVSVIRL